MPYHLLHRFNWRDYIELVGGGCSGMPGDDRSVVEVEVIRTGKRYRLLDDKAEGFMRKYMRLISSKEGLFEDFDKGITLAKERGL